VVLKGIVFSNKQTNQAEVDKKLGSSTDSIPYIVLAGYFV
jgi:hypothetical protein